MPEETTTMQESLAVRLGKMLPDFLYFIQQLGVNKAELKRYRTSFKAAGTLLAEKQLGIPGLLSPDFEKTYLARDTVRRRTHLKNIKTFFHCQGYLVAGQENRGGGETLKQVKENFLLRLAGQGKKAATVTNYRYSLDDFLTVCAWRKIVRTGDLSRSAVHAYQVRLFVTDKDRYCFNKKVHVMYEVKVFLKYLFDAGHTLIDYGEIVSLPKQEKKISRNSFKREEISQLFGVIDTESAFGFMDRTLFEILYATGMRRGELCALMVTDVNLEAETILIREGKGAKDRVVPLTGSATRYLSFYLRHVRPQLVEMIAEYYGRESGCHLFLSQKGTGLSPVTLRGILDMYQRWAGFKRKRSVHALRYSAASHLLENGASIRHIGELLGHRNLDTTGGYTKVSVSSLVSAIAFHPREQEADTVVSFIAEE